MAIVITETVKVPVYNSPLLAVCDGSVWIAYPGGMLTECGNQAIAPLRNNVLTQMCFLNLAVYIVDGIDIVKVPLTSGGSDAIPSVAPYPFVTTGATTPTPPPAVLTSTSGGTLAAQMYYVRISYSGVDGPLDGAPTGGPSESIASPEDSLMVAVNHVLNVASPGTVAGATGWNVYVGLLPGSEVLQEANIAIGTPWVEPTTGITSTSTVTPPSGTTPTNCFLCCNWRGRFVLAGDSNNPQNFYMARVGVPTDWNFAAEDPAAAVAGNLSESGQIGEPIVALIPYTDDYMLIGCTNSLWMLQGDPANGGSIVRVSNQMGLISPNSWCVDPAGTLYFIARGGLYSVRPIWEFYQPPQLLSGDTYDQYFQAIINGQFYTSMEWDVDAKYMHIFATPVDDVTVGTHLIFDQRNGGLWPTVYPLNMGPTATTRYAANNLVNGQRAILLGGWDGIIRQWTLDGLDDDGTAITASAVLGPFKASPEADILSGITIDFGEVFTSDTEVDWNATVQLASGPDAYSVTQGTPHTLSNIPSTLDRRQKTYRQRLRGGWFSVTISNNVIDTYFCFESGLLEFMTAGFNRERR